MGSMRLVSSSFIILVFGLGLACSSSDDEESSACRSFASTYSDSVNTWTCTYASEVLSCTNDAGTPTTNKKTYPSAQDFVDEAQAPGIIRYTKEEISGGSTASWTNTIDADKKVISRVNDTTSDELIAGTAWDDSGRMTTAGYSVVGGCESQSWQLGYSDSNRIRTILKNGGDTATCTEAFSQETYDANMNLTEVKNLLTNVATAYTTSATSEICP